jgi:hypothetical protein
MMHDFQVALVLLVLSGATAGRVQPQPRVIDEQQPSVLTGLAINGTAATVSRNQERLDLTHVVAGTRPTEYRISARADMANALWMPYSPPLHLRGWQSLLDRNAAACDRYTAGRRLELFLQVRTELGSSVRIVNGQRVLRPQKVESNIVSDSICVVPDPA